MAVSACSVIMKVFYAARMVRVDLVRAITFLAQTLTKWSTDCDKRLEALMGCVHKSWCYVQVAWIGDPIRDLRLHIYCDADFAGCQTTNRCISGVFMVLRGPNRSFLNIYEHRLKGDRFDGT